MDFLWIHYFCLSDDDNESFIYRKIKIGLLIYCCKHRYFFFIFYRNYYCWLNRIYCKDFLYKNFTYIIYYPNSNIFGYLAVDDDC